jgi:hypothetical protein
MNSLGATLDLIYSNVGKLSVIQYRTVCVVALVCGMAVQYQCWSPSSMAGASSAPMSSSRLGELQKQRNALQVELVGLERRLARYRTGQEDRALQIGERGEDLVHVIDRASRSTAVRVLGLVTAGVSRDAQHTYQLTVAGGYRQIAEFVRAIVGQSSPIVISEVAIHTSGWMYPSQPLEAKLSLQVPQAGRVIQETGTRH